MRHVPQWVHFAAAAALGIAATACLSGGNESISPLTQEALTQYEEAIALLETAEYERAKLELEELIDDRSDLSLALDSEPDIKAQARWAFVLANSLYQVNRWVETLERILAIAGPLLTDTTGKRGGLEGLHQGLTAAHLRAGLTPTQSDIVQGLLDGFLTDFVSFFNSNLRQIEALRENENAQSFSLVFRALPVRIGGFDIMDLAGEHDMGEVFFLESLYRLINGVLTTIIAIDLAVGFPPSDLVNHTLDVIAELSSGVDPVGAAINLAAAYIFYNDRLLGLESAEEMKTAGDFYEDGFLNILQAVEFMQSELATDPDQDDDLIGLIPGNEEEPLVLELHIDFQPVPVPGVDTNGLENLQVEFEEDILTSIDNISKSFAGEPGARISWARDIVPLLSLAVVTLLRSGVFDGLIDAALDSAELDPELVSSINSILDSDLLQTNVVEGLILGLIPDVFEFDVGAYFERNPQAPRNFLPFWTSPTTQAVTDPTTGEVEVLTDWSSPTLLVSWECNDALDATPFNAPLNAEAVGSGAQTFLFCNADLGHEVLDCDLFAPEGFCVTSSGAEVSQPADAALLGMLDDTRSPNFVSMHANFLDNLREMGINSPDQPSQDFGLRRDGINSTLPYMAFRDPSFGEMLWIKLEERNNEELDEYITPTNNGFRTATNRSLNALVHSLLDEILSLL